MEKMLQVGVISSTHGIRGEVKVFPTTDDPARFKLLKKVTLDTGREQIPLEIQGVKFFKQFVIVKFKGIDNINDIEKYKGKSLLVNREDAVALEEKRSILYCRHHWHAGKYGRWYNIWSTKRCDGNRGK